MSKIKVKMLSRNPDDYLRETKRDIHKVQRNYDPALHPFEVPREYVRALNSVKLERVFAKPYLASLDGHRDGVQCLLKHPTSLSTLYSASCDGEIRIWNLAEKKCTNIYRGHDGMVQGLCMPRQEEYFFSVGYDKTIKQWSTSCDEPIHTIIGKVMMMGIDHHWKKPLLATCGERVDLWEEGRSEPLKSYTWGVDSLYSIKFNPVEVNVIATTASDRSIIFYDTREVKPLRKVVLEMKSNTLSWNPMEPFIFTAACEDYNLYTFDMRNLKAALQVHIDHVSAVISVDYSPTGKEFVSGSYDKTLRIFNVRQGRSREVYHTKRMQRLNSVLWTLDNKYILSASDEMNIRMWKSNASEKMGVLSYREKTALNYSSKLKDKFRHFPEIKRIARHRHVPKHIYNAVKEKREMIESRKRKEANRRAHSKPGAVPFLSEKTKHIIREDT